MHNTHFCPVVLLLLVVPTLWACQLPTARWDDGFVNKDNTSSWVAMPGPQGGWRAAFNERDARHANATTPHELTLFLHSVALQVGTFANPSTILASVQQRSAAALLPPTDSSTVHTLDLLRITMKMAGPDANIFAFSASFVNEEKRPVIALPVGSSVSKPLFIVGTTAASAGAICFNVWSGNNEPCTDEARFESYQLIGISSSVESAGRVMLRVSPYVVPDWLNGDCVKASTTSTVSMLSASIGELEGETSYVLMRFDADDHSPASQTRRVVNATDAIRWWNFTTKEDEVTYDLENFDQADWTSSTIATYVVVEASEVSRPIRLGLPPTTPATLPAAPQAAPGSPVLWTITTIAVVVALLSFLGFMYVSGRSSLPRTMDVRTDVELGLVQNTRRGHYGTV